MVRVSQHIQTVGFITDIGRMEDHMGMEPLPMPTVQFMLGNLSMEKYRVVDA